MFLAWLSFALGSFLPADQIELVALFGQSNAVGTADGTKLNLTGLEDEVLFKSERPRSVDGETLAPQVSGKNLLKFGPEMSFGLSFAKSYPTRRLAIFKWAEGGTSLGKHWHHANSPPDKRFIEQATEGLLNYKKELEKKGHDVSIKAILWDQGESDSGFGKLAKSYEGELEEIIAFTRTKTNNPKLVWIVRGMADWQKPKYKFLPMVQQAQDSVAASDPKVFVYSSDGYTQSDGVHMDYKGQVKSGIDAFACYQKAFPE